MRRVLVVVTAVGMLGLAWAAPGAAAVRGAYSSSDCSALFALDDNIPEVSGSDVLFGARAAAIAKGFRATAADVEDKQLRKALQGIAGYYAALGKVKNQVSAAAAALRAASKRYRSALTTWTSAARECLTANVTVPTLSPGVTLPSGVTLPGGVTIPSLPR